MHVYAWTHEKSCKISDPINIIFEGNLTLQDVVNHLHNMGWSRVKRFLLWPEASDLFLPGDHTRKQDEQRIFPIIPARPANLLVRYHVRLWQLDSDSIIGSVHYETAQLFPPKHRVLSFERAEQLVANDFSWSGSWKVQVKAHPLNNSTATPAYHNGYATLITR